MQRDVILYQRKYLCNMLLISLDFSTFILCVRERPVLQGSVIGPKLWHTRKQIQPYALEVFEVWIFSLYYQHLKYR